MPSHTNLTADLDAEYGFGDPPYYEGKYLTGTPELPLGWSFDSDPTTASPHSSIEPHEYIFPFGNSILEDLPAMTWDQTSPNTTNPTTPASPSYPPLPTDFETPLNSVEEHQQHPTPRLLPKPYSAFTTSMQRRLRGYQPHRARQESSQPSFAHTYSQVNGSYPSPALSTKRNRSPDQALDIMLGIEDEDRTPDPRFDEVDEDAAAGSEPYAQLIFRALKSVANHRMVLKDIYEWFEKNTDKPRTSTSAKGWQNSIRHNLSMNGAFKKVDQVPPSEDSKKGFVWVLEDSALEEGVKSTTRYRKHNLHKKSCKTGNPAPQRQISGAKGGKAAKKSAMITGRINSTKSKRASRVGRSPSSFGKDATTGLSPVPELDEYKQHLKELEQQNSERLRMSGPFYQQAAPQSYLHTPSAIPMSSIPAPRSFQFTDVEAVADLGYAPLFYDDPLDVQEDTASSATSFSSPEDLYINYECDGMPV